MKQKLNFGPYATYVWTLITIVITVAIIFVCTYFPGLLWNMTSDNTGNQGSVTLDLPDVEEIISSSVDTSAIPPYYPPLVMGEQYPDATYTLVPIDEVSDSSGVATETDEKTDAFSQLVVSALKSYFYLSCSPSTIAQHTKLWSVSPEGQQNVVDTYCSVTVVVQQHTHLWTVTAYGSPTALTHLSRTPYSDADDASESMTWADEELKEYIVSDKDITPDLLQREFANFLVNSKSFNPQLSLKAADILEYEYYEILPNESTGEDRIHTIRFWTEPSGPTFEMVIHIQYTSKLVPLWQTMSISQVK